MSDLCLITAGRPIARGKDAPPLRAALPWLFAMLAVVVALDGLWIPAKAIVAQQLLESAWQRGLESGQAQRPWPWADMAPVARLLRRRTGATQIVLSGDSGRSLAFGPGWSEASAAPLSGGTTLISAHRDTHFAWLRDIGDDEVVELQTRDGGRRYRLRSRQVIDVRRHAWRADAEHDALLLVTCWPFDAASAGGPQRLLLRFEPEPLPRVQPGGRA